MRTGLLGLLFGVGALSPAAWSAVYHVARNDPGAADGNDGTAERPWATIQHAAEVAQPGDTVLIHAGAYPESVTAPGEGTVRAPITFAAHGDDEVILEGADLMPGDRWQRLEGSDRRYATPLGADPGQVLVDGRPIYMKLDRPAQYEWQPGALTDEDVGLWQFDPGGQRLILNLGAGNPAEGHRVEVPTRLWAFRLGRGCRLSGIRAQHYAATAIDAAADAVVEDCLVTDCAGGIRASGWHERGAVIRRNTVIGCLANGIMLQDRPTGCRVEENLVIRCTLNPWHQVLWAGSVKMNSAADSLFAHNVVLEAGNPATINGWDGWALWGDINVVRIMYVGNSCAHNEEAGLYVEYAMGDTQAYFNTSYRDGHGITCRQSQRGLFLRNYVQSPRSSGLAVWGGAEPYPTADHVFAHNLVRDAAPCLRLQIEQPEFSDYNTYLPREGAGLADGAQGARYATLDELRAATGHELHGEVRDAPPADVGLGVVTFRVPDAADPAERLMMIGNLGCEYEDPAGVNLLPYFWHPGTGDGVPHEFLYAAYTGLPGGVDTFAYPGGGATLALRGDPQTAHGGNRCLEVNGFEPSRCPVEGTGFWSPTIPARPGDRLRASFWVKGKDLEPTAEGALAALAVFTGQTGQHRTVVDLAAAPGLHGTTEWQPVSAEVAVPAEARRVALFVGLRPARGSLWLDDFQFDAQ